MAPGTLDGGDGSCPGPAKRPPPVGPQRGAARAAQAVAGSRPCRRAAARHARWDDDPIGLATAALERLDREINGMPSAPVWDAVDARTLVQAAVGRWQARARFSEATLELRWSAGQAIVNGDRCTLAQALDNLIVNAIEHGGPTIVVAARCRNGRLRIAVVDSGREARPRSRRNSPAEVIARLSGRNRHGHGLAVVRKVASMHEGRFVLDRAPAGSLAALELPLAEDDVDRAA